MLRQRIRSGIDALKTARRDESGVVAIITAVMMTALVGGLAIAVDTAQWRMRTQQLQLTADTIALDAAYGIKAGELNAVVKADAAAAATRNGWTGTIVVNAPPVTGPNAGKVYAVEVTLSQPAVRFFSGIFTSAAKTLSVRSVGAVGVLQTGSACISSLSKTASPAISIGSNSSLITGSTGCQLVSQSSATPAVVLGNNVNAPGGVAAVGTVQSGSGNVGTIQSGIAPSAVTDPYAGIVNLPSSGAGTCLESLLGPSVGSFGNNQTKLLVPGHYCNGWSGNNNATVNLLPGIYYIDSNMDFGNNVTINGVGVTLVIGPGVDPSIFNNSSITITAPTSGPTSGIAITQYTNDTSSGSMTFGNNSDLNLTGAVYLPTKGLIFGNNSGISPASTVNSCTQLLASTVSMANNSSMALGNSCGGVGVQPFGTTSAPWAAGLGTAGTGAVRVVE